MFVLLELLRNSWAAEFVLPIFLSRIPDHSPVHISECSRNLIIKKWPTERDFQIAQRVIVFKDVRLNKPFNVMTSFINRFPITPVHCLSPEVLRLQLPSRENGGREVRHYRDLLSEGTQPP
jgi:hypothetical protein